jgi:DNA-binding CsgD family transcriptional regulator
MQLLIDLNLPKLSTIDILRILHFSICLLGAYILIITWRKINVEVFKRKNSLLFIVFALVLWCAMDLYRILGFMKPAQVSILLKILSTYNNALFLCALPFFELIQNKTYRKIVVDNPNIWVITVLTANIFIVMLYSMFWSEQGITNALVKNFDVLYSVGTMLLISTVICISFSLIETRYKWYLILSLLLISLLVLPQLTFLTVFSITHFEMISVILLLSHSFLISMILILAHEWQLFYISKSNSVQLQDLVAQLKSQNDHIIHQKNIISNNNTKIENLEQEIEVLKNTVLEVKDDSSVHILLSKLSDREIDVLKQIQKSYSEIGMHLFISRDTVITHKKNIESKLGIRSKEGLIDFAIKAGLIN